MTTTPLPALGKAFEPSVSPLPHGKACVADDFLPGAHPAATCCSARAPTHPGRRRNHRKVYQVEDLADPCDIISRLSSVREAQSSDSRDIERLRSLLRMSESEPLLELVRNLTCLCFNAFQIFVDGVLRSPGFSAEKDLVNPPPRRSHTPTTTTGPRQPAAPSSFLFPSLLTCLYHRLPTLAATGPSFFHSLRMALCLSPVTCLPPRKSSSSNSARNPTSLPPLSPPDAVQAEYCTDEGIENLLPFVKYERHPLANQN